MDQPITLGEVARILHVAEATARKMADEGRLVVQRTTTGLRIFERENVERVAAERLERRGQ